MSSSRAAAQKGTVALVVTSAAVGAVTLLTLNTVADDPEWTFVVQRALIFGLAWYVVTNAFREWLRRRLLDDAAATRSRPALVVALTVVLELLLSIALLALMLASTGTGTWGERVVAAVAGTAAAFALDALVAPRRLARDAR